MPPKREKSYRYTVSIPARLSSQVAYGMGGQDSHGSINDRLIRYIDRAVTPLATTLDVGAVAEADVKVLVKMADAALRTPAAQLTHIIREHERLADAARQLDKLKAVMVERDIMTMNNASAPRGRPIAGKNAPPRITPQVVAVARAAGKAPPSPEELKAHTARMVTVVNGAQPTYILAPADPSQPEASATNPMRIWRMNRTKVYHVGDAGERGWYETKVVGAADVILGEDDEELGLYPTRATLEQGADNAWVGDMLAKLTPHFSTACANDMVFTDAESALDALDQEGWRVAGIYENPTLQDYGPGSHLDPLGRCWFWHVDPAVDQGEY